MCEKREKRLDRSLPRSPRTRSASPPDARASPHAATWPVSGINSQLLSEGLRDERLPLGDGNPSGPRGYTPVGVRMDSLDWPALGQISHFHFARLSARAHRSCNSWCNQMGEGRKNMEVEMKIRGLMMDPVTNMPIVILKDINGNTVLPIDRKSTRLNSSHLVISYAV